MIDIFNHRLQAFRALPDENKKLLQVTRVVSERVWAHVSLVLQMLKELSDVFFEHDFSIQAN
jgi:hypothetical protein